MIAPLLVALALAGTADPAAPGAPVTPDPGPEVAAEAQPSLGGWRHGIGLGLHSTTFSSKEGSQYTFHSASLGYLGSFGTRGAFLQAFALVPLQARQDGRVYSTSNYYRRRSGGDLLFGYHWRWRPRTGVEVEAGPGLHGTFVYLPGRQGYRDFSAFPVGLGASGVLWWGTGARRLSRAVNFGTYASVAYDFRDPLHADDIDHGYTFRVGVALGLGGRL